MVWQSPINLKLVPSSHSMSFQDMDAGQTALPQPPHVGAFGISRKHHIHEGIDLYCPEGTEVFAVEDGQIVNIVPFTGAHAGSDWWHDTYAVLVEGKTGVVVYGEILSTCQNGQHIKAGDLIGHVKQVLKTDKGRPMSMLHLELYMHGVRDAVEWPVGTPRPDGLMNPTPYLLESIQNETD